MKKKSTLINESARKRLGITRDEYALCAYVHYRIADPANKQPGWCTDGREEIAEFIGITRRGLLKMANRMEEKQLLEVGGTGAIRVGETWIKEENACEQSSPKIGNKVPLKREQSSPKRVNKVPEINKGDNKGERLNTAVSGETAESTPYTFDDFWQQYAFKVGSKKRACEKFKKLSGADREAIRQTLPLYLRETVTKDAGRKGGFKPLRKYPEFYLSGRIWEPYLDALAETEDAQETPYDEAYQKYLDWTKQNFPHVIQETKHMSKTQFIQFKSTFYVPGKSILSTKSELNYLTDAHRKLEVDPSARHAYPDVFTLHCEYVQQSVKSHSV